MKSLVYQRFLKCHGLLKGYDVTIDISKHDYFICPWLTILEVVNFCLYATKGGPFATRPYYVTLYSYIQAYETFLKHNLYCVPVVTRNIVKM